MSNQEAIALLRNLEDSLDSYCELNEEGKAAFRMAIEALGGPQRKTGKWEEREVSSEQVIDEWQSARCSVCGLYHTTPYLYYFNSYNYCPNCGADMRDET